MANDLLLLTSEGVQAPARDLILACDYPGLIAAATSRRVRMFDLDRSTGTEFFRAEFTPVTSTVDVIKASASFGNLGTVANPWTALFTGAVTASGLTAGRIIFAGAGGLLTDDLDLTFDGVTLRSAQRLEVGTATAPATVGGFIAGVSGGSALDYDPSNLNGRLQMRHSGGTVQVQLFTQGGNSRPVLFFGPVTDINEFRIFNSGGIWTVGTSAAVEMRIEANAIVGLSLNATTALATTPIGLEVGDLTSGRVTFAGAAGRLTDSANLTFSGSTLLINPASAALLRIGVNQDLGSFGSVANYRTAGVIDHVFYTGSTLGTASVTGTERLRIDGSTGLLTVAAGLIQPGTSAALVLRHHGGTDVLTIDANGGVILAAHNTAGAGENLAVSASNAVTAGLGGSVTIDAGNAVGAVPAAGGLITLEPGAGTAGGADGDTIINTAAGAAALTVAGATGIGTFAVGVEVSDLTADRIVFAGASGRLSDDDGLKFTTAAGLVGNDAGGTAIDLRWETDNVTDALEVDASAEHVRLGAQTLISGTITPATLSATEDDFAPTDLIRATRLRLTPAGGGTSITGLTGGVDGRIIILQNIDTTDAFTLVHESGSSAAANRFALGGGVNRGVANRQGAIMQYDGTSSRWRLIGFG